MTSLTFRKKVVMNECYGGFGLSKEASRRLADIKGLALVPDLYAKNVLVVVGTHKTVADVVGRDDPDLIRIVEEMGEKANGFCADLVVKEIEITIDFSGHDGYERIKVMGHEVW